MGFPVASVSLPPPNPPPSLGGSGSAFAAVTLRSVSSEGPEPALPCPVSKQSPRVLPAPASNLLLLPRVSQLARAAVQGRGCRDWGRLVFAPRLCCLHVCEVSLVSSLLSVLLYCPLGPHTGPQLALDTWIFSARLHGASGDCAACFVSCSHFWGRELCLVVSKGCFWRCARPGLRGLAPGIEQGRPRARQSPYSLHSRSCVCAAGLATVFVINSHPRTLAQGKADGLQGLKG